MNIINTTKRQFDKIMERTGKSVYGYQTDTEYKVLFTRTSAQSMQEKIKISYSQDCDLDKGSIVKFKGKYYLLINQDNIESDVYCTSNAIKCNDIWNIGGVEVPVVCGNLSSTSPNAGIVYQTDGKSNYGSVMIYTASNTAIRDIKVGDINYVCDDFYHIVNNFSIDGMTYIYMQKDTLVGDKVIFYQDQKFAYKVGDTPKLRITKAIANENKIVGKYIQNEEYIYTSSDNTIATIDTDGTLHCLALGTVCITVTCGELKLDVNLNIVNEPYGDMTLLRNDEINDALYLSILKNTITINYYDKSNSDKIMKSVTSWEFFDESGNNVDTGEGMLYSSNSFHGVYYQLSDVVDNDITYSNVNLTIGSYGTEISESFQSVYSELNGRKLTIKATFEDGTETIRMFKFSHTNDLVRNVTYING